jgi:DNA-binding NarL/FixJ family response regulator
MKQLTLRELEIAVLVAQGLSNKEIAQRLCVSQFTVRMQVISTLRKLGLKNRIQLAFWLGQRQRQHEGLVA